MAQPDEYPDELPQGAVRGFRGRGAGLNPGNRFESVRLHVLGEYRDHLLADLGDAGQAIPPTIVYRDDSRSVINRAQPNPLGIKWTINPYRGCEHGCAYCYAREYHEMLGFSCGLDFETKIMAKPEAAEILRRELARPSWRGETICMPTATDCYQPIEAKLGITRRILEVLAECRQPVGIVTKSKLVLRDLDLLTELARHRAVRVSLSLTTLDNKLAAKLEPRASSPRDRLATVRQLAAAGIPVAVMVDPIIPGLTDREMPAVLEAAAEAGAQAALWGTVRLPHAVREVFHDWLNRNLPDRAGHVMSLMEQAGCGSGATPRAQGAIGQQLEQVYEVFSRRHGLNRGLPKISSAAFRRPALGGQSSLF